MPEQELDLFEIAASLSAELGTGTAEIVGAEALDADLLGGLFDDGPNRPITQTNPDLLLSFPDPGAALCGMSQEVAQETITRWDLTLRKQGLRLYRLQGYIYGQDHLTIVAPDVQELIGKAVGSKFDRVVNLQRIGASLFFYQAFPVAETPDEKAV